MLFDKDDCNCLHEDENNLQRTQYCFIACHAQRNILKRRKAFEDAGLPVWVYTVRSTSNGVEPIQRVEILSIEKGNTMRTWDEKLKTLVNPISSIKYSVKTTPFEVVIYDGDDYCKDDGYGTGEGDLWAWTHFSALSKERVEQWVIEETQRINEKYHASEKS